MGRSFLNNGWYTLPRRECQPTIAEGLTSAQHGPRGGSLLRRDPRLSTRAPLTQTCRFVHHLFHVAAQRPRGSCGLVAPLVGVLGVTVQQAVASTALGQAWPAPRHPCKRDAPPLQRALELAGPASLSRLPLRP